MFSVRPDSAQFCCALHDTCFLDLVGPGLAVGSACAPDHRARYRMAWVPVGVQISNSSPRAARKEGAKATRAPEADTEQ